MKKSKVYMVNADETGPSDSLIDRFEKMWNHEKIKMKEWIQPKDIVAIKTHFGAKNQTRHLRPMYIRKIVDLVREAGGIPWVFEGVGLGWELTNKELNFFTGPGYVYLANFNGFSTGTMNAPVAMDDGTVGTDVYLVENDKGKYIKNIALAMGLRMADKVIITARFKGHGGAGFGGALKQLGIGCVGKEGKGAAHFGGGENIYVKNKENCKGCGKCIRICPVNALYLNDDNKIVHDEHTCIACLHCFEMCHHGIKQEEFEEKRVFAIRKRIPNIEQVERMMDNAAGVLKGIGTDRIRFFNIAVDITAHCDCLTSGGHLLVPDLGIFYSEDPIAIDQACVDLVNASPGVPKSPAETGISGPVGRIEPIPEAMEKGEEKLGLFSVGVDEASRPKIVEAQLAHASALELGSREYELVDLLTKDEE